MTRPRDMTGAEALDYFRSVVTAYRQAGYNVLAEPELTDLLGETFPRPDLAALRDDDRVLVEIIFRRDASPPSGENLHRLLQLEGWRYELAVAPRVPRPLVQLDQIRARIDQSLTLQREGHTLPALLLIWTATEETLRTLLARAGLTISASHIVTPDQIYGVGLLGDHQYALLQQGRQLRNQVAHGASPVEVPADLVERLAALATHMLDPNYVPPTVMADRLLVVRRPEADLSGQAQEMYPDATPEDIEDAVALARESFDEGLEPPPPHRKAIRRKKR
jgi:hypothetical protein